VRRIDHGCPILIVADRITTDFAVGALRAGVSDIIDPDAPREAWLSVLAGIWARSGGVPGDERQLDRDLEESGRLIGRGRAMQVVRHRIVRVAATDANVLISGESGTGKELTAELIHRNSLRSSKPFVSINCAAIPEPLLESELFGYERGAFTGAHASRVGKLQHASGGTLFLDEIGDMSVMSQAKILRAIETRVIQRLGSNVDTPIQVRLIAATNQNLEQLTREKKFRQDLYFRLNVVRIDLPPLRDRREDIPELAEQILTDLSSHYHPPVRRLQGDVVRRLQLHDWPGNVRELRNVLETILVFTSSRNISISDVPPETRQRLRTSSQPTGDERSTIINALSSADWNRGEAARILHCSRMTLYRKMRKYSIA
jgi:DNA-binding NtrC family response regulator